MQLPNCSKQTSFFESTSNEGSFKFVQPALKHEKDLKSQPLLQSVLLIQEASSFLCKTGKFVLHNKLLAFRDIEESKKVSVLDISYSKFRYLNPIKSPPTYGFSLSRDKTTIEFYSEDKAVIDNWVQSLKKICIMASFHQEYKPLKLIGKGSFAFVYLAQNLVTKELRAVKAFNKEAVIKSYSSQAKVAILNEVEIIRNLDHENIIKLYEVHETEGSIYLIMELIEGISLDKIIKRPSFGREYTEKQTMLIIRSILNALTYISSRGIMHRDLKPENILVERTGRIKIVDFGLATYTNKTKHIFDKCGTPGYIAPEVFQFQINVPSTYYNDRCDVFSAGCLLFHMLFGRPLFTGATLSAIIEDNRGFMEFVPVLSSKAPQNYPDSQYKNEALDLLSNLLEYNPKQRCSAAQAFNHRYFASIAHIQLKTRSSKDIITGEETEKYYIDDSTSFSSLKIFDMHVQTFRSDTTPVILTTYDQNRYTTKNSLFLDIGRPEINGGLDTVTSVSAKNSMLLNTKEPQSATLPSSSFGRKIHDDPPSAGMKIKKIGSIGKGASIGLGNSKFYKAAILNNIHKKTEKSDEPDFQVPKMRKQRSEKILAPALFKEAKQNTIKDISNREKSEPDDICEEDCQIHTQFAAALKKCVVTNPSKMLHSSERTSLLNWRNLGHLTHR